MPVASDLDDPDRAAGRAAAGRVDRLDAGIVPGSGCAHRSTGTYVGRGAAGSARRPRPTRTCSPRRRAGSRGGGDPRPIARSTSARPSRRRATARGRRGRRRRCSSRPCRPSSKVTPAAIRRPPTVRKLSRTRRRRARRSRTGGGRRPGSGRRRASAGRGRRSPQRRWWSSMNASRSAAGPRLGSRRDRPGRLRAAELAPDLVALLLAEGGEVGHRDPGRTGGEGDDRADVLALEVERPAGPHLAPAEGRGEGVGGRVAAAETPEVDDVPRLGCSGSGRPGRRVGRQRLGDRGQVGRGGEDRRVVGVVGRPRRRPPWPSGGPASVRSRAWRQGRVDGRRRRLDLVAVHERDDADRVGARGLRGAGRRRRASGRGRWRRRRPTRRGGTPSARTASPMDCGREASQVPGDRADRAARRAIAGGAGVGAAVRTWSPDRQARHRGRRGHVPEDSTGSARWLRAQRPSRPAQPPRALGSGGEERDQADRDGQTDRRRLG